MINNLLTAVHTFTKHMVNLLANNRDLSFTVEMAPSNLKHISPVLSAFMWNLHDVWSTVRAIDLSTYFIHFDNVTSLRKQDQFQERKMKDCRDEKMKQRTYKMQPVWLIQKFIRYYTFL